LIEIPASSAAAVRLFACMSRFEFALKEAGYVSGAEGRRASPNWTEFEKKAEQARAFTGLSQIDAVKPLFDGPPKKQLRSGMSFEWGDPMPVGNFAQFGLAMRQVRNNLFHGGKAGADPRDDMLCEAATAALVYLLTIDPDVRNAFEGNY
jgi:hypothetical protein